MADSGIASMSINSFMNTEKADFYLSASEKSTSMNTPFDMLIVQYREIVVNSLVTAFGLDKLLFVDVNGGNVQTMHNAGKRIYANKDFEEKGERKYNRNDYVNSTEDMSKRRKRDFQNKNIIDGYTGRELPKDGRAHLDHIVSAKENHDNTEFRILFEKEEMRTIINSTENTLYTDSSLNQSKGEHALSTWMDKQQKDEKCKNAERYGVNRKKAKAAEKKSHKYIDENVARRKIEHYANGITQDGLKQGGTMAIRQALGVIFTEITMIVWDEMSNIKVSLEGKFSVQKFFDCVVDIVKKSFSQIKKKMPAIVEALSSGFTSGFFNSIVTTIINMFATTAENVVRILRQGMTSITEAVRILFFDRENRSPGERLKASLKIILAGAATVLGVFLEQSLHEILKPLAGVPVFGGVLVDVVSVFAGVLTTGLLSVTFMYFLDNSEVIKKLIAFIDSIFVDGFANAKEKFEEANRLLDDYIAELCEVDLEKLKEDVEKLQMLNSAITAGNIDSMYRYCSAAGISLQFSNTEEFNVFMEDDDTILEI